MTRHIPAPDMEAMRASLCSMRESVVARIHAVVDPHLTDCGFTMCLDRSNDVIVPAGPLLLWAPMNKKGRIKRTSIHIGGDLLDCIWGISEDGPITDRAPARITVRGWNRVPLEDLLLLEAWVTETFAGQWPFESPPATPETTA